MISKDVVTFSPLKLNNQLVGNQILLKLTIKKEHEVLINISEWQVDCEVNGKI